MAPGSNGTSHTQPVAFVIGAGPHIGTTVAHTLYEQGYVVALGSRKPHIEVEHMDKFSPVVVDAAQPASVRRAFQQVVREFGHPTVVIYNAASSITPPDPKDPLSLESQYFQDAAGAGAGVFAAAQEAVDSFRLETRTPHPKVFIVTGNAIAFEKGVPDPTNICSSIGKRIQAQLIASFADAYQRENFRFYFASLVSSSGGVAGSDFRNSGATHAKVYWDLIANHQKQGNWDYRFTLNGLPYIGYE